VRPKFILHPAQKLCIEKALKFLPKLKEALKKHQKAQAEEDTPDLDDILNQACSE
jgi:hypothetical protein